MEIEQLAEEYEMLEKSNESTTKQYSDIEQERINNIKEQAKKKLDEELKNADDKTFANLVIKQLLKRCVEDSGLAEDVIQEHKTWSKCVEYIYDKAQKQMHEMQAVVRDIVVYEWAEDYYHKDDKAEEEAKAKEEAERIKRQKEAGQKKKKEVANKKTVIKDSNENSKKQPAKKVETPKKNTKDVKGQLDIFSIMGI